MTGGRVIILGPTGVNFSAGMSGGIAYVLDENQLFDTKCNLDMVDLEPVIEKTDMDFLFETIKKHVACTGSRFGYEILSSWEDNYHKFVKVFPIDYKKALERIKKLHVRNSETMPITEEV